MPMPTTVLSVGPSLWLKRFEPTRQLGWLLALSSWSNQTVAHSMVCGMFVYSEPYAGT